MTQQENQPKPPSQKVTNPSPQLDLDAIAKQADLLAEALRKLKREADQGISDNQRRRRETEDS